MKSRPTTSESDEREFRRLVRDLDGVGQRVQIEQLAQALIPGPVRVEQAWRGLFLNRLVLRLVDGPTLALRLFYPAPRGITSLTGIHWDDRVGWIVHVAAAGDDTRLYAFSARTIERARSAA